jgi:hypothetical protein
MYGGGSAVAHSPEIFAMSARATISMSQIDTSDIDYRAGSPLQK